MQKLIAKTDVLIAKARKLAEQNHKLQEQNQLLENEIKNLKQVIEAEVGKSSELNNKIKIIKLARNIGSAGPPENAQVNEYIREIDNCITMLND